ncbi:phosphate transport system permease protein [Solibacillus kalamii]|uniref:Phosphate transport system permease protein PstA n=2 Tax=Solibacillus TaxID=648800 RepID=K1KRA3_9BACL|nr:MULTISPECIES: phosphate ABC transporter permease PstA [Solibacillus]AMO86011.1 phosphate ABC transporter, permease protein PstA [Solibacillus silvestris]EKB46685.1 Phosphate transport system permease protein pstA [Solibacillus isronensis B3W22]MBM7664242.1 phosphate transport system permease protein [Solibacillus kalamii]OUZ39996.1 phosphate ABC transporter, permease protein PstA [Solibacillus kalamii]
MRQFKDNMYRGLLWGSAFVSVAVLVVIVGYIFYKGFSYISFDFIFGDYSPTGGGGIFPMIVTTILTIVISLLIATPIGILAAVYLHEYAKQGRLVRIIRYATESLTGIPSIIYGLFGAVFFVVILKLGMSIIAASLTLTIIVLPVIIRTTEEALKTVPATYREGSLALGTTKLQTLIKVILPSAMPGILSGIILSIGRIVGESAAIFLTAGTVAAMPSSIFSSARTLTVHSYLVTQEAGDIGLAAAIGIVLIVIILVLNLTATYISKKLNKADY